MNGRKEENTMDTFYRYEDLLEGWNYLFNIPKVKIVEYTYSLIKETPKGYWITNNSLLFKNINFGKRWISKTAKKRYAYPTKEEAINGFIARKNRQVTILSRKLEQAKQALNETKKMQKS